MMLLGEGMPWEGPGPPTPPPHRGGGGHRKPAQDAGQGVGCYEGCPLDPHGLGGGQQSSCHPALHHPGTPLAAPWGRGLPPPLPMGMGPPPSPSRDWGTPCLSYISLPLDTWLTGPPPPPRSPRPAHLGVPAAPTSTHCKFIIWVLWAFLEGPRVAELLDMVGFIETAGEGRGRA